MTNSHDAFSNELKSLFGELQDVLTNDLAATAKEADVKASIDALEKRITQRITQVEESIKTLKNDFDRLNNSVKNLSTSIESINVRSPSMPLTQTVGSGNPQTETDQYGVAVGSEIKVSGETIAGHPNKNKKAFSRKPFTIIDSNEYTNPITSSAYYQQSVPQADILITNALPHMQGDQGAIVAIQTCILIDLLNISFLYDKESDVKTEYKLYETFIKGPNTRTFSPLHRHLLGYELDESTLSKNNLQTAIEGIASLAKNELNERIAGITNKKFETPLTNFIASINQIINNNRNPSPDQPAADSADQGPQS